MDVDPTHPNPPAQDQSERWRPLLRSVLAPVLVLVAAMWLLEVVDVAFRGGLDDYGIRSRTVAGLLGVPLAPFLHGGFSHLLSNTAPLLVLALLVAWRSQGRFWWIAATIALLGGLGVWLLGPNNVVTIGASGLVFGLLTYLIASGILARSAIDILLAVAVLVIYGGLLTGVLPWAVGAHVSWLAHLAGAGAGVVAAWAFAPRRAGVAAGSGTS